MYQFRSVNGPPSILPIKTHRTFYFDDVLIGHVVDGHSGQIGEAGPGTEAGELWKLQVVDVIRSGWALGYHSRQFASIPSLPSLPGVRCCCYSSIGCSLRRSCLLLRSRRGEEACVLSILALPVLFQVPSSLGSTTILPPKPPDQKHRYEDAEPQYRQELHHRILHVKPSAHSEVEISPPPPPSSTREPPRGLHRPLSPALSPSARWVK